MDNVTDLAIEELKKIQAVCEHEDGEFAFNLANAIEDRVQYLKTASGKEIVRKYRV